MTSVGAGSGCEVCGKVPANEEARDRDFISVRCDPRTEALLFCKVHPRAAFPQGFRFGFDSLSPAPASASGQN